MHLLYPLLYGELKMRKHGADSSPGGERVRDRALQGDISYIFMSLEEKKNMKIHLLVDYFAPKNFNRSPVTKKCSCPLQLIRDVTGTLQQCSQLCRGAAPIDTAALCFLFLRHNHLASHYLCYSPILLSNDFSILQGLGIIFRASSFLPILLC